MRFVPRHYTSRFVFLGFIVLLSQTCPPAARRRLTFLWSALKLAFPSPPCCGFGRNARILFFSVPSTLH